MADDPTESTPDDGHETFGLVMPFVVVESNGGPYDDASFVAGYECGLIATTLASMEHPVRVIRTVHTANLPQLDLIAMQHGYRMTVEATDFDEWTGVEFENVEPLP